VAAAQASMQAGAFGKALELLAMADAAGSEPLNELARARVDLLRGHIAFASALDSNTGVLLLNAARRIEPFNLELARETYLMAFGAVITVGTAAGGGVVTEICRAVQSLPPAQGDRRPLGLLLQGLALLTTDGRAAATQTLQRATRALAGIALEDVLRWGWMATAASTAVWDDEAFYSICTRQVQLVRDVGALAQLPLYLSQLGIVHAWMGDFAGAASLIAESDSVAAATGSPFAPYALLMLQALQGREAEASPAIASVIEQAAGAEGTKNHAHWAAAILHNGLARYQEAAADATQVTTDTLQPWTSAWALPELVEAATRIADAELAHDALARLAEATQPCGTDWALGIEARCRALLSDAAAADNLYREAVDRLSRTRLRSELARAHLLYGEWLHREDRRADAREHLRTAHNMLAAIGMEAFAERARRELIATGGTVRTRSAQPRDQLTPQEEQIARLARDGLSNPEIGAQLFLSARTVEWHLRKVFSKLGIGSRRELQTALAQRGQDGKSA
jgi:ATP/maltotriose-dependent transcriptional regulator MalT